MQEKRWLGSKFKVKQLKNTIRPKCQLSLQTILCIYFIKVYRLFARLTQKYIDAVNAQ